MSQPSTNGNIIFDVRSLQDANYRDRGVGRLGANILRSARRFLGASNHGRVIGLADPELPPLEKFGDCIDEIRTAGYFGNLTGRTWFIELSPMTHDPLFQARILNRKDIFKISIVHDFIPLHEPLRYLPTLANKIDYATKLAWLARYDHFFPNSNHTSSELKRIVGIPESRISVTGPPVDAAFQTPWAWSSTSEGHILIVGGAEVRKNVECALRAHAKSSLIRERRVPLLVAGNYPEPWRASLREVYASEGGSVSLMAFLGHVPDHELAALYRSAACVVVPSRAEGFSIPVVEAMAAGTVVLSSSIPAHRELVDNPELMFEADDAPRLANLLDSVLSDSHFRERAIEHQSNRWQRFRADDTARAFWRDVERHAPLQPCALPYVGRQPRIAVLSPLPPDRSGVADYTAASLKELSKYAEVHVFTATKSPQLPEGATGIAPISAIPALANRFDRIIGVMGNSHFHTEVFDLLMRYGGACIEHDNRLLGFYRILLGEKRAREVAERELRRPLERGELERWLADEATLEATFLGEIAERSDPLCVHSRGTARLVYERFRVNATYLPFCVYREWHEEQFASANRIQLRACLGIPPGEVAIVTMGYIALSKAPEECIWALALLRGWGIPAKLYFVGEMATSRATLEHLSKHLGLTSCVSFISEYVDEQTYRNYLLSADAAVQLRTHTLGGVSGALLDCISVGLPTVANCDLAESVEAPSYVIRIPDRPSPVLIAEALATAVSLRTSQPQRNKERAVYCGVHNFQAYAEQLCAALSLDVTRSKAA